MLHLFLMLALKMVAHIVTVCYGLEFGAIGGKNYFTRIKTFAIAVHVGEHFGRIIEIRNSG